MINKKLNNLRFIRFSDIYTKPIYPIKAYNDLNIQLPKEDPLNNVINEPITQTSIKINGY